MAEGIHTAAVLGAGIMGGGIAAHLAGCGIKTHLLDIVPPDLKTDEKDDPAARNRFADGSLKKLLKAKPAAFYDLDAARLIQTGNFDDHLDRLKECDLVIEAIIENLDIKKSLFEKVGKNVGPDTIVASNTSGLSIAKMSDVLPANLQERFLVMHFFNPVRYMKLLELVAGPKTKPDVMAKAAAFGERLGKGIVYGKDTANFVANRIGIHGMMLTFRLMQDEDYSIEEVDKIAGKPMGRPKTAIFKLADLVGIDTLMHVTQNCYDSLVDDEERDLFEIPAWVQKMVDAGMCGRKSGGGFYRKEGKDILVLDYKSGEYRAQNEVKFGSLGAAKGIGDPGERLKMLVKADDRAGNLAWKLMSRSLAYTARRIGEIADDIVQVDNALKWGFNWDLGPFEAWDAIGVPESVARMKAEGIAVPRWVVDMIEGGRKSFYEGKPLAQSYWDVAAKKVVEIEPDPHRIHLDSVKKKKKNVLKSNIGASLVDIGDGVLCLEVHTKMNTLDADVVGMLVKGVEIAEKKFDAMVIGNDGEHFGAGANIMMVLMAAQAKQWEKIENEIRELQGALQRVKYAKVPVVAAPFSLVLGGACEVCMACDACQAFAETYMGLVEVGVGVLPAGGGCTRMVERYTKWASTVELVDLLPFIGKAAVNIAMAKVGTGAEETKKLLYLQPTDGITLSRERLLYDAKQRALGLARAGYRPPLPPKLVATGEDVKETIMAQMWGMAQAGWATEHDALVAGKIVHILTGGNRAPGTEMTEQDFLDLEVEGFVSLCGEKKTVDRIEHMLKKNKPLRN